MKLFYTPAACSISPHIALEETGAPFETQLVNIMAGESRKEEFLRINPKGKIPTLILDNGTVVTENPVILQYIAREFPDAGLIPTDMDEEFAALSICDYLTGTIQNFALTRLFRPNLFSKDEQDFDAIRKEGAAMMEKGFGLLVPRLQNGPYLFDNFSIADASLFYFELHASRFAVNMPAEIQEHFNTMAQRPSVQKVMEREGLKIEDFISGSFSF